MPKKIYDIKPPHLINKTDGPKKATIRRVSATVKEKKKVQEVVHETHSTKKKEKSSAWLPILVCTLAIVLAIGTYLFFKLPKADITIWPKVETLSFKKTITADKSVDVVDVTKCVIPAQYFQATKTIAQDFPATGNALNEGRATGNIMIYNKHSSLVPVTFKTGTHFMSDSGKLFVSFQKVVVPAAKKIGTKITPGSVQIQVQAVEGGDSYNIAPSNFSVPGLKGTSYYYAIYATSASAMTGGYSGKVKKVTDDDIQGAKEVLVKKTTDDAVSALKDQIPADYILLENALLSNTSSASTATKVGTVVENFNYQVTVTSSALAFKKSDIENFAKNYTVSQVAQGKTLLENSLKADYSASVIDVSGGKATINLDFSAGVYQNIDKNSLTLSVLGQNANQIKQTIDNSLGDQISKTQVKFWPFWVSAAPRSQKVVNVDLKF